MANLDCAVCSARIYYIQIVLSFCALTRTRMHVKYIVLRMSLRMRSDLSNAIDEFTAVNREHWVRTLVNPL